MASFKKWDAAAADVLGRVLWTVGAPIFAVAVLFYAVQDIGPSYQARFGDPGTRGTFTATEEDCSGRGPGCSYYGDFRADDGSSERRHVILASGHGDLRVGSSVVAYDNGDRAAVYPAGGGHDWIYVSLFGAGTVVLLVAWLWSVPGGFIRRRGRGRRRG